MKAKIFVLLAICIIVLGQYTKYDKPSPITKWQAQTCSTSDGVTIQGWYWDKEGGHCDYCGENCSECGDTQSSYETCSICQDYFGEHTTDSSGVSVKKCYECGPNKRVKDCCWNDITDTYGFHAKPGKCDSNSVQFGNYCMPKIANCIKYSANTLGQHKDSVGYTRCQKCEEGYYLTENYKCERCYHISWDDLEGLNGKLIPQEANEKTPKQFTLSDINTKKAYNKENMYVCKSCNSPGQCTTCKRGYYMTTNAERYTFDQNIARNPSACKKCNKDDDIHQTHNIDDCAHVCESAKDKSSKNLCKSNLGENICWRNPDENFGCQSCTKIKMKYIDSNSATQTVNLGQHCLKCNCDNAYHTKDSEINHNCSCTQCDKGFAQISVYNPNREDAYGYICLEGRTKNENTPFTANPSLLGNTNDATSSPKDYMLKYDSTKVKDGEIIMEVERVPDMTPPDNSALKLSVYTQKFHYTIPNCASVTWDKVSTLNDKTKTAKYVVHFPTCGQCENGYVKYDQIFVFQEKNDSENYSPKKITICRKCSDVIKERDQEYLGLTVGTLAVDNHKYVRRCEPEDQTNKKYKITQCAYSTDEKIESGYPEDPENQDDENQYRGPKNWFRFGSSSLSSGIRQLEKLVYLATISSQDYNSMTWCIPNIKKCRYMNQPVQIDKGLPNLKNLYKDFKTNPTCKLCYEKGNYSNFGGESAYQQFVKTQNDHCEICDLDNCSKCEAVVSTTSEKSGELMCIECQNNIRREYYPNKWSGNPWDWTYDEKTNFVQNYYTVTTDGTKKVVCQPCDSKCQLCSEAADKQTYCDKCQPFYRLSLDAKSCEKCYQGTDTGVQHCIRCDTRLQDDTKKIICDECMPRYALVTLERSDIQVCERCETHCYKCFKGHDGRKRCELCDTGYYLDQTSGVCQERRIGCLPDSDKNGGKCTVCQYGYTLINGGWCYDCMRQNYAGSTPDTLFDNTYTNYVDVHGFIFCTWSSQCATSPHVDQYTNVRRSESGSRILELLDDIFE